MGSDLSHRRDAGIHRGARPRSVFQRVAVSASNLRGIGTRVRRDGSAMFRCGVSWWKLRYAPRRVSCLRCEGVHVESMPWVSGKQWMTRALMATLATWTRVLPWKQLAQLSRCAWGTVASAVEEAVTYGLALPFRLNHYTSTSDRAYVRVRDHFSRSLTEECEASTADAASIREGCCDSLRTGGSPNGSILL